MKKALLIVSILTVAVVSTACINNIAIQELNNKAAEYMQKGDYEAAMNRLEASLDLDNTAYQTYYNLGVAAINANKYDKAIEALENGIKIKPDYADFYYSLGVAQIGLADHAYEEANEAEEADDDAQDVEDDTKNVKDDTAQGVKVDSVALKKSAITNLNKYLELEPAAKDKNAINEMIKQCEEFIAEGNGTGENKGVKKGAED